MKDITESDLSSPGQPHTLTFYDGSTRNVFVNELETPFPSGELIVSQTTPEGIIKMCNQAFVTMSGYTEEELLGQSHSILRHPEMPRAAFKDLWETIKQGKKWDGYVKNLRKDGGFYWVHATIVPNIRKGTLVSYTSVRREPPRRKIEEITQTYRQMIQEETGA